MQLTKFDGGLSLRLEPHLIKQNEALVYTNIDNDTGILKPIKEKKEIDNTIFAAVRTNPYAYFFEAEGVWVFSPTSDFVDWVEWQDRLYFTDGTNPVQVRKNGTTKTIGIEEPPRVDITFSPVGDAATHVYQYGTTYYSTTSGAESSIKLTPEVTIASPSDAAVTIRAYTTTQNSVDRIRLYRIGGTTTKFTLVTTLFNPTNVTSVTYSDSKADSFLLDITYDGDLSTPFQTNGMRYLTEYNATFYGAIRDKLYFSRVGRPFVWRTLDFLTLPKLITGIGQTSSGLLVFTLTATYLVTGSNLSSGNTLQLNILSADLGCTSQRSVQSYGPSCIWVNHFGICVSNGSDIKVVTKDQLGTKQFEAKISTVYDNEYYLHQVDGSTFIVDFDRSIGKYENHTIETLFRQRNKLLAYNDSLFYELYQGEAFTRFKYLSPKLSLGVLTTRKTYKTVYVASKGMVRVKILVDDQLAVNRVVNTRNVSIAEIKLDVAYNKGLYIQFDIQGTGIVYEINFDDAIVNA